MKQIRIRMNPYRKRTTVHAVRGAIPAQIAQWIEQRDVQQWCTPYREGYQTWDGLLVELAESFGDDALTILFTGSEADFVVLKEGMKRQAPLMEAAGYCGERCSLVFEPGCGEKEYAERMKEFIAEWETEFLRAGQFAARKLYAIQTRLEGEATRELLESSGRELEALIATCADREMTCAQQMRSDYDRML